MRIARITSIHWDERAVVHGGRLMLPARSCSVCRVRAPFAVAADLPEAIASDAVHLLASYQSAPSEALLRDMAHAADAGNWNDAVWDKAELAASVSPQDFQRIATAIRKIMHLDERRLVLPRAFVGPATARAKRPIRWDLIGGGAEVKLLATAAAAGLLAESGLTGFSLHPVYRDGAAEQDLFEIIVFGSGGLPLVDGNAWTRCTGCGEWYLANNQWTAFELDPDSWDGSDPFHFAHKGYVYATERAIRFLDQCKLHLGIGLMAPEQDSHAYRAYLARW